MTDANKLAIEVAYAHLDDKHEEQAYSATPKSCGTGSYACPLCDWQIFIDVSGDS